MIYKFIERYKYHTTYKFRYIIARDDSMPYLPCHFYGTKLEYGLLPCGAIKFVWQKTPKSAQKAIFLKKSSSLS